MFEATTIADLLKDLTAYYLPITITYTPMTGQIFIETISSCIKTTVVQLDGRYTVDIDSDLPEDT